MWWLWRMQFVVLLKCVVLYWQTFSLIMKVASIKRFHSKSQTFCTKPAEMSDSATRTTRLYQHHSCRSSSCPRSSPPGCRNTAELPAGSLPSSSASPPLGPATRTSGCRLQQCSSESVSAGTAWPLQGPQPAQVGQGRGSACTGSLHWLCLCKTQRTREDVHVERKRFTD